MPHETLVFNLGHVLNYPIQLAVNGWQAKRPLRWSSFGDDGLVAEGQFLEAPGLPLFTLEDDEGNRLSDRIPEKIADLTHLMQAIDFELAQACTVKVSELEVGIRRWPTRIFPTWLTDKTRWLNIQKNQNDSRAASSQAFFWAKKDATGEILKGKQ